MDLANRECLTSQAVWGIWIVGYGCSPGKRYQRIRTCLTGEVESPSSPIRRQAPDVKYPEKVERRPDRISNVRYPEKAERRLDRIPDVRYPEKVERRPDKILDVRYPEKVERRSNRILSRVKWAMPHARMKISVITDISIIRFYGYIGYIGDIFGYIGDISVDIIDRIKIVKNSWKCKKNLIII